jgi:hypothetical protein
MRDPQKDRETDKETEMQQKIESGDAPKGPDAAAYQTLFQGLGRNVGSAPAGFSFRVMDQIIRIRVRTAEKQAKRLSLLLSVGLTLLAVAGLAVSVWFGWLTADWITALPLMHLIAGVGSVLLLVALDVLFEAQLTPVETS